MPNETTRPGSTVLVWVNGERRELEPGSSLTSLIAVLGLEGRPVAVEHNREVVPKAQHRSTVLRDGDRVEVVTLVGGG